MNTSIKLYHDTRRALKGTSLFPVKLSVCHTRKTKKYSTGVALSTESFAKLVEGKYLTGDIKREAAKLSRLKSEFDQARNKTIPFSFERFEKNLSPVVKRSATDLLALFELKIQELKEQEQTSTAISYTTTLNKIREHCRNRSIDFIDISPEWLNRLEKFLANSGNSTGTIGIYMRNLRHIYNRAMEAGSVDRQLYPFGNKAYRIKAPARTKKALSMDQLKLLVSYWKTAVGPEKKALDYWLFSLTSNGLNMRDMLEIKWNQFDGDSIRLRRIKTSKSNSNQSEIVVHLNNMNREIIDRLSQTLGSQKADEYLFPDFIPGWTEKKKYEKNHDRRQYVTKYVKAIGKKLGIATPLSFETARHTFANSLKYQHVSTSVISNFMGHSSTKTTDNYLGSIMADEEKVVINDFIAGLQ